MRLMLLLAVIFVLVGRGSAQMIPTVPTSEPVTTLPNEAYIRADRLGVTFISSAQNPATGERYANALALGAGWTRWPLYWYVVQPTPEGFDWTAYDELVREDLRFGLNINAILLGRPEFFAEGETIAGINEPIFSDGSDYLSAGKTINPANPWAVFAFEAVQRYKPGGVLARQEGWPAGQGVRVWEVWNEPDLKQFWGGSINQYARLLKVAYLAGKLADPDATMMFGGLLYNTPDNWLARVLSIFVNDTYGKEFNYYFDAVAIHSYSYPWRTGWLVHYADQTLIANKIKKPIWVTETGVNVWNDYPGPTWALDPEKRLSRATADQQAWFIIQSAVYAYAEGADVVLFHQLYDDCGDLPAGTDFPPNNGDICSTGDCFGDAYGLFRNPEDYACFTQHPFPGTPRPGAQAFKLLADIFGSEPFADGTVKRDAEGYTIATFDRPDSNERIRVIWNLRFEPNVATLPAEGRSAQLYTLDRGNVLLSPIDDMYTINLRAAEPDSYPFMEPFDKSAIGGPPVILIERVDGDLNPPPETTIIAPVSTPLSEDRPVDPTPGPLFPRPTGDPNNDTTPPSASVDPLPPISSPTFTVNWSGSDDVGVVKYLVWVRVNEGEWLPWLETARTSADYTGEAGMRVDFAVWAQDAAGNWSSNTDLAPQASTRIE